MSSKVQFLGLMVCLMVGLAAGGFHQDVDIIWGDGRGKIINGGRHLALSLDNSSGSAFISKKEYLFGRFDCQIKLVGGNSAGTVTTFYLSSQGEGHDEIDFEFLGNASGEPYTLHTNVFAQGKGDREQQFRLWFDPTKAFHTYSIVWNPQQIIFLVDNSPLRVFKNNAAAGIPFPTNQPMRLHCSLWNADDWATQGGRVKTDWSLAPFVATFRYLNIKGNACDGPFCDSKTTDSLDDESWKTQGLDAKGRNRLRYLQKRLMVYNYCQDRKRFSQGIPRECKLPRFL